MTDNTEISVEINEKIKKKAIEPSKYNVVFLNDEVTPVDWVVKLLTTIFKHSQETAENITLTVHHEGSGVAGTYTYEIAEQKTVEASTISREQGFPLQIQVDRE